MQNAPLYFSHAGYNRFGALSLIPDAAFDHFVFPRRRIQLHRKPSAPLSLPGRRLRRFSPSCAGSTPPTTVPGAPLTFPGAAYDDSRRSSLPGALPTALFAVRRRLQRSPAPLSSPGAACSKFRRPSQGRRRLRRLPAPITLLRRRLPRFSPSSAGPSPPTTIPGASLPLSFIGAAYGDFCAVLRRANTAYENSRHLSLSLGAAYGGFRRLPPGRRRLRRFPAPLLPLSGAEYDL